MSGGLYSVLGVSRGASKESIRVAYLRLAKQLHPDVNKAAEAPRKFQRVRDAYEVLSDDARRREHDLQMDARGFGTSSASSSRPGGQRAAGQTRREPFGRPGTQSYWAMYDRARRAQQDAASSAAWQARQQQAEQEFAQSHPGYQAAFDQERYRRSFSLAFFRMMPFMAPVWIVILLLTMRRSQPALQSGPSITFDHHGRAFAADTYGQLHRLPAFDKQ